MNHYIYSNKGHNLINNIECKKEKRRNVCLMYILFISFTFYLSFLGPERRK